MNDRINTLTTELQKAADSYYNSGIELMSNLEYDKKFDELKELEAQAGITNGFTSKVGAAANNKLKKVTHEYEAKSLDKTKSVDALIGVHSDPAHANVCLSWKCDGSTVQLTYDNGKLTSAVTRGDGVVGQDITKNSKYIANIPREISYKGKLVVRGEALMTYDEFNRLNTNGDFANARNLANATITALDKNILEERKTEFKAFELVYQDSLDNGNYQMNFSARLDYLKTLGFGVVEHKSVNVKELKSAIDEWSTEEKITSLGFPVDGLVICNEDCEYTKNLQGTEHHPNAMKGMAFKWQDEEVKTKLRDIEWQVGRTGVLTPVAVFDTVDLCGTKVTKASLHNISYIKEKDLRIGDEITVYKANMIIPQVGENLSAKEFRLSLGDVYHIPKECPCCKKETKVIESDSGVLSLNCSNEKCPEKEIGRFTHFVSKHGMNIDGLSENTLRVLLEKGFIETTYDLYHLEKHRQALMQLEGFGEKSTENLLSAIENSKKCDFSHFMYAQGIDGIGRGQIKALKNYIDSKYDTLFDVYGKDLDGSYDLLGLLYNMNDKGFDFTQIDGIGTVLADSLSNWIENNLEMQDENYTEAMMLLSELEFSDQAAVKEQGNALLAGKSFCITGSLESFSNRDEMVKWIEDNGGKFVSGVSSKTDYLVNNDITSTSGKNKKAKELGIPIVTEKMLIDSVNNGIELPDKSKLVQER